MSHTLNLKSTMTDEEAIVNGLVRRGFDRNAIEVHEKAVDCTMFNGQMSQANIVVRRDYINQNKTRIGMSTQYGCAFADLGFIKEKDGTYKAVVDGSNFNEKWVEGVTQCYNAAKVEKELKARKIKYVETRTDTGAIQFKATFQQQQQRNRRLTGHTVSFG